MFAAPGLRSISSEIEVVGTDVVEYGSGQEGGEFEMRGVWSREARAQMRGADVEVESVQKKDVGGAVVRVLDLKLRD